MTRTSSLASATLVASLFLAAAPASGQTPQVAFPQASPPSLVRNQIGLTTVEVEYARPSVRGRKVFGELVPYGEVWRTGANTATKITFSGDVTFGGETIEAGTYSLFTIPGKDKWTVILNQVVEQFGSYAYDETQDIVRLDVAPVALREPVETLTIGLDHLRDDRATFSIAWETTRVAIEIETDLVEKLVPQIEAVMAGSAEPKPYLPAAMFYYEHDLDLAKARAWIEAAEAAQPEAVWIVYRKGLILAKAGDKDGARKAAQRAGELAQKAGGPLGAEYGRLSATLAARLK